MSPPHDHETPTVEAAGGFERYHAEPDWDHQLAVDDARREPRPPVFVDYPADKLIARPGDKDLW